MRSWPILLLLLLPVVTLTGCETAAREPNEDRCAEVEFADWDITKTAGAIRSFSGSVKVSVSVTHAFKRARLEMEVVNRDAERTSELRIQTKVVAAGRAAARTEVLVAAAYTNQVILPVKKLVFYCGDKEIHSSTDFDDRLLIGG